MKNLNPLKNTEPMKLKKSRRYGWRKIVFNKERVTYRHDLADINVYVYKDDYGNFKVKWSIKSGGREKDILKGSYPNFTRANKKALSLIKASLK